jgi:endo-1,4-beta-xylanase
MLSFSSLIIAATAVVGALAAPSELVGRQTQTLTFSQIGTHGGFYYNFWTDGGSTVQFTLGPGGSYSSRWGAPGQGNWIGGKGWSPGTFNRYDRLPRYVSIQDRRDVDRGTVQGYHLLRYLYT